MTFNDVFKSSFLENITSVSILDMALALLLAFGIGLFIYLVYKKTYQGVMYSSSFGTTLIALTMITTVVILAVTSNVGLCQCLSNIEVDAHSYPGPLMKELGKVPKELKGSATL